ncbi:hypothetical protein, variant 2 [Aphanomyces invadans]|uniref:Potassium channel domain-containing protein n=1 Tax=Aphanomyces invadans TaxID=157072 RepID=A0A024USK5_9STRA|nr:hypothetical protein, variant 2 [Aphanomyces invadans]ETW09339.1 hypothetical protein, variant 2 [Aphanomyces invadans]|eukprot:XP_008863145.1 hypothetical protein, variant 2 [Aphanomyces invadans]
MPSSSSMKSSARSRMPCFTSPSSASLPKLLRLTCTDVSPGPRSPWKRPRASSRWPPLPCLSCFSAATPWQLASKSLRPASHPRPSFTTRRWSGEPSRTSRDPQRGRRDFCIELSLLLVHIPPGLGQYTLQTLVYIYANSFSVTREAAAPLCPKYPMYVAYNCYAPTTISISQFGIVLVPRIYLVGRYIRNVFGFNTNEVKLIGSLQNVDAASAWFVRKFLFRFYPAAFSAFILIALWTLTAWAVDQAERSIANGDLAEYVDVLWLVVVTISTVGYGDCAVVGFPGRVFIVVGGVVGGAAICSMCRVVVVGALAISPNEQCVIDTIKEREEVQQMRSLAVHLIQAEWRRYKLMSCSPAGQLRHDVTKALHTARVLKYRVMALARSMRRTHQRRHQGLDAILTKWKGKVEQENDMDTTRSSFGTLDRTVRRHDLVVIATCDKAVDKLTAVLAKLRQPHVQ